MSGTTGNVRVVRSQKPALVTFDQDDFANLSFSGLGLWGYLQSLTDEQLEKINSPEDLQEQLPANTLAEIKSAYDELVKKEYLVA